MQHGFDGQITPPCLPQGGKTIQIPRLPYCVRAVQSQGLNRWAKIATTEVLTAAARCMARCHWSPAPASFKSSADSVNDRLPTMLMVVLSRAWPSTKPARHHFAADQNHLVVAFLQHMDEESYNRPPANAWSA
jgi:hypothetical protein